MIKKTLLIGFASLSLSTVAGANTAANLKPLQVSLSDAAEQFHQQQTQAQRNNPSKLARMQYYKAQEKPQLPKKLSQHLILETIKHDNQQVSQYYHMPSYQSQEQTSNNVTRLARMLALKDFCEDGSNSKHLLQTNIDVVFIINDKNNNVLLEETMRLSDCEDS